MNALNWKRYCREKTYKQPASVINSLQWLSKGEEHVCARTGRCNPWTCTWFADGFGMFCGEECARQCGIPYYIPNPYVDDSDPEGDYAGMGAAAWRELEKQLPIIDLQLTLF